MDIQKPSIRDSGSLSLKEIKNRNIRFFNKVQLNFYNIHSNPVIEKINRIMVSRFTRFLKNIPREALPHACVLDAGCNDGYFIDYYYTQGAKKVIGCDLCYDALNRGRNRHHGILRDPSFNPAKVFVQGDLEALPLFDASFDTIVCFGTWHHIVQKRLFLQECLRVLLPGGVLCLSDPNDEQPLRRTTDWCGRKIGELMPEERPTTIHTTQELLLQQGFVDMHITFFNVFSEMFARLCSALLGKKTILYYPMALIFLLSIPLDWFLEKTLMPLIPRRVAWTYVISARKPKTDL